MEFRKAIVDECGEVKHWWKDLTYEEIYKILDDHPEWKIDCVEVD